MGVKISNLPIIVTPELTDVFPVVQAGVTYKETISQLGDLFNIPASVGASGTILRSDGTSWLASTSTFADTYNASTLLYSNGANTISGLATANSGTLVTSGAGVPSIQALSAGQILVGTTSGAPVAAAINSGTNITVANGSGSITVNLSGIVSPTLGGTGVNNGSNTLTLAGTLATAGAFASTFTMTGATNVTFPTSGTLATTAGTVSSVSGTSNRITSTGGTTPVIDISASYVGQSSITTLGTIGTGVWQGTLVSPIYGGTGINNGANTLTLGGTLATSGAFASVFTMTGATNVTFPTSGTLLTSAGAVTSLAATANQTTVSAATGAVTTGLASNAILPGTGGVTLPQGNTAARAGGAGTMRFNTQSAVFESTVDGVAWATIDTSTSGDVDSIIGTANQVIASNPTGNVTLSLPQSIATTSNPTFAALTLTSVTFGGSVLSTYSTLQTWTPTFTFATPGDLSVVYSAQGKFYSRVGNIITINIYLGFIPTYTTSSGLATISGLPFANNATALNLIIGSLASNTGITFPAGSTQIFTLLQAGASTLGLYGQGTALGVTPLSTTTFPSGVGQLLFGQITYQV